jgi:HK97 gp10 family phage protein
MASKVRGLERLKRQLRALPNSVRAAMADAMEDGAREMVTSMRSAAPVLKKPQPGRRAGALRDSINYAQGPAPKTGATGALRLSFDSAAAGLANQALTDAGLVYTVYAGDDEAYYARWVEFGTAASVKGERIGARSSDVKQAKIGRKAGRTHPGTRAQPFFYPTIRAKKKPLRSRVLRATNKAAKAVAALR